MWEIIQKFVEMEIFNISYRAKAAINIWILETINVVADKWSILDEGFWKLIPHEVPTSSATSSDR
jgi:hypothetical protein